MSFVRFRSALLRCVKNAVVLVTIFSAAFCAAQTEETVRFRRWYAPLEHVFRWPWGEEEPYYRFDGKKFEEIVDRSRAKTAEPDRSVGSFVFDGIQLRASLQDTITLEGNGTFQFRTAARSVPLDPLGFWLTQPAFSDGGKARIGVGSQKQCWLFLPEPAESPNENGETTEAGQEDAVQESAGQESVGQEEPGPNSEADRSEQVSSDSTPSDSIALSDSLEADALQPNVPENEPRELNFQWSLRGQKDSRGNIVFNISTPPAVRIELELTLPSNWIPSVSEGIVRSQAPENGDEAPAGAFQPTRQRKWKLFLGGHNRTTLVLTSVDQGPNFRQKIPIQQTLTYHIRPEGLDVNSTAVFEKTEIASAGIVVELDEPLEVVAVQFGGKPVFWMPIPFSDGPETRQLYIALPEGTFPSHVLSVDAVCPIRLQENWTLPGIRFHSPQHFWMETRSNLFVTSPLMLSGLVLEQACQTTSTQESPNAKEKGYFFQYFGPDSRIAVELAPDDPNILWNSGTLVHWEEDKVSGVTLLDFGLTQEHPPLVELLIQPQWSIDSVELVPKENVLYWEAESSLPDSEEERAILTKETDADEGARKSLFVYVKKASKLRITGRFSLPASGTVPLRNLIPVRIRNPIQAGNSRGAISEGSSEIGAGKHLLAVETTAPGRLKLWPGSGPKPVPIPPGDPMVRERFSGGLPSPDSSIFSADASFRTVQIGLEPLKLSYTSDVKCNLTLNGEELTQTYRFECFPTGSRIDRVLVHFSQDSEVPWIWKTGLDQEKPLLIQEPAKKDLQGISVPVGGKVWEVRLPNPRSGPFVLTAKRRLPIEKMTPIPLATLPESTVQQAELVIESAYDTNVEIVNTRLKPIPIAAPGRNEYQTIRAAFRYDPSRDIDLSESPSLSLRPQKRDRLIASAWVWSLQLDSQFEAGRVVREHATFFIENRGQKQVRITLPQNIRAEDILAVWIEDERVPWYRKREPKKFEGNDFRMISEKTPSEREGDSLESPAEQTHIFLTLPERRRFTAVSLEYSHQAEPLVLRKTLQPDYPEIDLPVLNGTWIVWAPPEFQTFLRKKPGALDSGSGDREGDFSLLSDFGFSLALDPAYKVQDHRSFDPFASDDWQRLLSFDQRRRDCLSIAERLIDLLGDEKTVRSIRSSVAASVSDRETRQEGDKDETIPEAITWGNLLGDYPFLSTVFEDTAQTAVSPRIIVDWTALRRIGIFPTTPVAFSQALSRRSQGYSVLENAGLSLLFFDERDMLITSSLNAAKYRPELDSLIGDRIKIMQEGPLSDQFRKALDGHLPQQWVSFSNWNSLVAGQVNPWGNLSSLRLGSVVSGWSAVELKMNESSRGVYIAYRPKLDAYYYLAFLVVLVLTRMKPFYRVAFLIVLLFLFSVLAQFLPPYYAVVPRGAFFGTLCGIGFSLLRFEEIPRMTKRRKMPLYSGFPSATDSSDAEFEVRELRPFNKVQPQKTTQDFFDSLQKDLEGWGAE